MNKLWIDWILCSIAGIVPGVCLFYNWKLAIIFVVIAVAFHIWRWKNWDKIFAILGTGEQDG